MLASGYRLHQKMLREYCGLFVGNFLIWVGIFTAGPASITLEEER